MSTKTWNLEELEYNPALTPRNETLFALGNGNLGVRGDFEEGTGNFHPGTYVNGFFEMRPIEYGESAYGYAKFHQTIQNIANPKVLKVRINGTELNPENQTCSQYRRNLDLKTGTLERSMCILLPDDIRIEYTSRRFVSLADPRLFAMEIKVTPLDDEATVIIESQLDGSTTNRIDFGDPRVSGHAGESKQIMFNLREGNTVGLVEQTRLSRISAASAITHQSEPDADELVAMPDDRQPGTAMIYRLKKSASVIFRKYAYIGLAEEGSEEELRQLMDDLRATAGKGFQSLYSDHCKVLDDFWRISDIRIGGNPEIQLKVRYSLFQLFQAGRFLLDKSIPAKGLTSEGYEGHIFWDTEIFVMPFFAFTRRESAKEVLRYRYGMLDAGRARAREMAEKGALFPWRTINGQEASAFFLAGTAQYHINAAVAYAIRQYINVTGDNEFLLTEGAEILFETARTWISLGFFNQAKGGNFCLNGVTGPDEYTALVNNNCYTNMMARFHLRYATEVYYWMAEEHFEELQRISGKLGLKPEEVDTWYMAAEAMHIPYSRDLGIHLQDDDILFRKPWDFANTPKANYPLLLNYHPLVIYRHRVLKQPDMLMAAFLLPEEFSEGEHLRAYEFYTPLTTFDSSLGAPVQAIISAREGRHKEAWKFFTRNLDVDLEDIQGNVKDGLHMAATGGTWQSLVFGFGGLKMQNGTPWFIPHLPDQITELSFNLNIRKNLLSVRLNHDEAVYQLLDGDELEIRHEYENINLKSGEPITRSLKPELRGLLVHLPPTTTKTTAKMTELISSLESIGIRTILCGADANHPLTPLIHLKTAADEVAVPIPDPEAFFTSATQGNLMYRNCLILTGFPDGREAAERAGMACHFITDMNPATIPATQEIMKTFDEFHRP